MNLKTNIAVAAALLYAVIGYAHEHASCCTREHSHEAAKSIKPGPFLDNIRNHDHNLGHSHDSSCRQDRKRDHVHSDEGAKCETTHEHGQHAKTVSVTEAVQQVMGLKTVSAENRRVASTFSFAGRYELAPDARKIVASPVAGRLTLLVKTLDNVRKGEPLFKVTSPDLVARSREILALENRLKVYREIKTPNAALENQLAVKRAEREAMLAGTEERDGVVTVRAASDGMIESLIAQDGAWLETGAAALQTVQMHNIRFKALVAASDALHLKNSASAKVGTNAGRIQIGAGDDSGLVPIYILFDSAVSAISGERGVAECVTNETEKPHIAVPSRCIVSVGLQPTVFVKDPHNPERFIATPVTPVVSGGGWTAIEGLSPQTSNPHTRDLFPHRCEIVSEGVYELKLALPSSGAPKESGHFHADGTFHTGEH